ncbi:hypothetical protein IFM89_039814 [Coptis chinensis]|uniref:DUF3456 domain-containing protein n=1 Tax=Coptis chinensis TaxID=261450 RepID=A0A835LC06_9MAGN|nr:hypothetical protein IFM89_039814 [Coptis chinensis]
MPRRHNGGSKLLGMLLLLLVDQFGTQVKPLQHQVGKFLLVCERKSTEDIYSLGFKSRLQTPFNQEKPRNHLDLRNWLNSKDQREGKVIDYRVSELRVVELLDGLCEKMQEYTLDKLAELIKKGFVKVGEGTKEGSNAKISAGNALELVLPQVEQKLMMID